MVVFDIMEYDSLISVGRVGERVVLVNIKTKESWMKGDAMRESEFYTHLRICAYTLHTIYIHAHTHIHNIQIYTYNVQMCNST